MHGRKGQCNPPLNAFKGAAAVHERLRTGTDMWRKLVINADDFGYTRGINIAISECARAGALRSATLMPNSAAFDDAVRVAKDLNNFGTGIHFVLTDLAPVLPPDQLRGLVGPTGLLPRGPGGLLKKIARGGPVRDAIARELHAQAEKVFDCGIRVTHFDSHKHVHILPMVLDILVEIAKRFSVKIMRTPFEGAGTWNFFRDVEKEHRAAFLEQYAGARLSSVTRPYFRWRTAKAGIQSPTVLYGISFTGFLNEKIIRRICATLKPGLSELMTHPGIVDEDLVRSRSRLLDSRAREMNLLISEEVIRMFKENDITLGHFGEVGL